MARIYDRDLDAYDSDGVVVNSESSVAHGIQHLVSFLLGITLLLLAARFVLHLVGGDGLGLSGLVDRITDPLVAPFSGLVASAGSVDVPALVAMVGYALVAWAVNRLLELGSTHRRVVSRV